MLIPTFCSVTWKAIVHRRCIKYRNFTYFFGAGILWKPAVSGEFWRIARKSEETVRFHKIGTPRS